MLFLEHVPLLAEAVYPIWLESYYRSTRERARVTCATAVAERRPRRSPSAHRTGHRFPARAPPPGSRLARRGLARAALGLPIPHTFRVSPYTALRGCIY
jgi:hypothetical protein